MRVGIVVTRPIVFLTVWVATLLSVVSASLRAQERDSIAIANMAARVFARLEPGELVRVRIDGERVQGRVLGASAGLLTLRTDRGATTISAASMDSLWVRGTHTG